MNIKEHKITFNNQELLLNNQRTIYWPAENALILSDLHLGKAAHFRKHGIPIPTETSTSDLQRLADLIDHYQVTNLLVVGDLIHAGINLEVELLKKFTQAYPQLIVHLIAGNHDKQVKKLVDQLGLIYHSDQFELMQIHFQHQPSSDNTFFNISGHIHPGISILLPPKKQLRLPCFWVSEKQIILPAFSKFTGLDSREMPATYCCYAIQDDLLLPITNR
ncbi:ligase-associated DNA damage response endonuclease PdeM [Sphingobacterium sp. N143]|uniref:ligase-associated DNA damage response endonuclease PdeM n=1 Tax=Sphingobacterium sp. N143 TaxID=2746727 RepID=UPI00257697E5|nr:ligase-associated DNA damage response endonuclease PdeM [Sphingobacterium sp. N143]MDM1296409.1 ligase-associated DNA damage response endonuclease PdeM [Sphingobacterium sp. N143]